jgi:hypothetical protein
MTRVPVHDLPLAPVARPDYGSHHFGEARSNRAIVFASHLFHETDRMRFKEGYANRRINLTLLYGRR